MSQGTDPPGTACEFAPDDCQPASANRSEADSPGTFLGSGWDLEDVDAEWERSAIEQLNTVEYDTDLGVEMSRDALRVAQGELSKREFHDRYHDELVAEFGVDDRPTKSVMLADRPAAAPEPDGKRVPSIPGGKDPSPRSRRTVLKAMGGLAAAGAAGGLAGCLGATEPGDDDEDSDDGTAATFDEEGVQMGMVVDTDRCIACLQCSLACKEENNTDRGVHWPYVFRYEDELYGERREGWLTRHCQHCSEASCTYVCPTQARYKREDDGIVLTDYDTCVGCKYCQVACPYGVNYLGKDQPTDVSDGFDGDPIGRDGRRVAGPPPKGVMGKCTFCVHRQDSGDPELEGTTACEQRCPVDAIHFGDMHDPDSDPRQHMQETAESNQFRLLEDVGNEPNIVFIGRKPSKDARPIQGPMAYEEHGMTDGNYEYLEGGEES